MTRRTTCRICESACGLRAEVEQDRVVALTPDPDDPVSQGFACVKGTRFAARVQHHPERLTTPLWHGEPTSWAHAQDRIGAVLQRLLAQHGPESVGLYSGNAIGHQLGGVLGLTALQRALGTTKHYSCLTLDNSEQFVVAEAVFGNPLTTFVADYEGSDCTVLIGTDPLQSQPSQSQSHPRGPEGIRARGRAGELWVVDPRRSVTARAGHHVSIRPGTDPWLLAGALRRVLPRGTLGEDTEPLTQAVASFTEARVSEVTGVPRDSLEALYQAIEAARHPLVWSGLGVLLGPHGTLGWWLTLVLQAALGGIGNPWRYQPSALNLPRWFARLGIKGRDPEVRSPVGNWPAIMGTLPAATLAGDVLRDAPDRLRALIVVGGDPAAALPNTTEARRALERLDLLVCVDLFVNHTGRHAHAVLPAATWLERDQIAVHAAHQRPRSHLRWTRAVVPPRGDARSDWTILTGLARAAARPAFGSWIADRAVRAGLGPVTVARLAATLSGVPWRAVASDAGHLGPPRGTLPDARYAVPEWCAALAALPDPEPALRLVTSVRPLAAMNHWIRPDKPPPAVIAHPRACPAGPATLRGPAGALAVTVVTDPTMEPGTVVLGFGDGRRNPNQVIPSDVLEPFSGQPVSNGTPVTLTPGADPTDP